MYLLRLSVILVIVGITNLFGNNLQITNVSVSGSNISFKISWENSWRITNQPPFNWDAVWIVVKRKDCASTDGWRHVNISKNASDHSAGDPLMVETVPDSMGVFIHLKRDSSGNISNIPVTLKMVGVPNGVYDFKVIGIEMVYIPQDSFWVGDAVSTNRFYKRGGNAPYLINNSGTITIGTGNGQLYATGAIYSQTLSSYTVPGSGFPKGYKPFYVMKYEITQGQYVDFLNSLASDQAAARGFTINTARINITGSWPSYSTNFPHRAMAYLSWDDLGAYLDWVALAPMTELDYEKVCRGPRPPVGGEYAWGTTAIVDANALQFDGTPQETHNVSIPLGSGIANYGNNGVIGPVRVGFAARAGTTREQAGASYYGVMELSGNVWERVITFARMNVSSFSGRHGDGEITTTLTPPAGRFNVPGWPTTINAIGLRGGSWGNAAGDLRVSDRRVVTDQTGRHVHIGGRGLRRVY